MTKFLHPNIELCKKAAPEIEKLKGKVVSIKIGGEIAENLESAKTVFEDLVYLCEHGVKVVLCHGGGPQITRELKSKGVQAVFIEGQRVTDLPTLMTTCSVLLGEINRTLVSLCNSMGNYAIGISGLDAKLFEVTARDAKLGYVGLVKSVNTEFINVLLGNKYIPIVATLGIDNTGQVFNVNADSAAGALAGALKAEHHLVFTNVEGLYHSFEDKSSLLNNISVGDLKNLFNSGNLSEGMIPKIESILTAMQNGVKEARIIDGRKSNAILHSFIDTKSGTRITQ